MPKSGKLYLKKKIGQLRGSDARNQIMPVKPRIDEHGDASGIDSAHLTKDQRYYLRHKAEINQKNSERNRRNRAKKKRSDEGPTASDENTTTAQIYTRVEASTQTQAEENTGITLEDCFSPNDISTQRLEEILDGSYDFDPTVLKLPAGPINHMSPHREYVIFMELRKSVRTWGSLWGGVDNWDRSLDIFFTRSKQQGYRESHMVVVRMFRISQKGKHLLGSLDDLHGRLPTDNLAVSLLWRYHDELVKILVKGITILDCRLDYIHRSITEDDTLSCEDYKVALGELTRTHSMYYVFK